MSVLVEIKVSLAEEMIRQLHERARHWGVNEDAVVEQALGLLCAQDDPAPLNDYWFSVSTMREDWEAMPEEWYIAKINQQVNRVQNTDQDRSLDSTI